MRRPLKLEGVEKRGCLLNEGFVEFCIRQCPLLRLPFQLKSQRTLSGLAGS